MSTALHSPTRAARTIRAGFAAAIVLSAALPAVAAVDPVLEWNDIARELIVVPALAPVEQTRAMAIVHVAMHDAVKAITGEYRSYAATGAAAAGATPEAAAIAAAFMTLKRLFDTPEALALRQDDGAAVAKYVYLPPDAGSVGVWAPISSAPAAQSLLPGWGAVATWVLRSGCQVRPTRRQRSAAGDMPATTRR